MLRELKLPGIKNKINTQKSTTNSKVLSIDTEIAINLIDILFKHVLSSIQYDRSSVKLNAFQRGMIGGVVGKTRDGTTDYVIGMRSDDIKLLLDDIEKELMKRKRT